ncbi:DUF2023 family protein [Prolixibacteraceae bacterium JC049]|nr:DUF2023 family protein [Prolixibacteraceae bacterium JC049]
MKQVIENFRSADLQILIHHIYEFKKGIRSLVLHTMSSREQAQAEHLLVQKKIDYIIERVNDRKINIFFGRTDCISVVKSFGAKSLSLFSPEEDFILGIMLGYNRDQQCQRYITRKNAQHINAAS